MVSSSVVLMADCLAAKKADYWAGKTAGCLVDKTADCWVEKKAGCLAQWKAFH